MSHERLQKKMCSKTCRWKEESRPVALGSCLAVFLNEQNYRGSCHHIDLWLRVVLSIRLLRGSRLWGMLISWSSECELGEQKSVHSARDVFSHCMNAECVGGTVVAKLSFPADCSIAWGPESDWSIQKQGLIVTPASLRAVHDVHR